MTVADVIDARGGILAAHDGSTAAGAALRAAAELAGALGTHVTVVRAWSLTSAPRPASWTGRSVPPLDDFAASTLAALEADIAGARSEHPDVEINATVVHGSAADKLVEASDRVDLIVVGSRGRGGFRGMLLGSVSEQVVRYARCRVLVDRGVDVSERETPAPEEQDKTLLSEISLDD